MRNIPAALQTILLNEVISLAKCLKITKSDGSVVRLTQHDLDLNVGGDVYFAGIPLDISAIASTDTLSVDNAEIKVGLDDARNIIVTTEFEDGLYDKAPFELFLTNWEDTTMGVIYLKRGELGDITFVDKTMVQIQLRGLTQSLQRAVVEKYSPTCRVNLGGVKCGAVNSPTRIRRPYQKVKTFDWFLIPTANVTDAVVTNSGFESDGAVANGTSGITGWTYAPGSYWKTNNAISLLEGSYYLEGGNDGLGSGTGTTFTLYKTVTTAALGMSNGNVDAGDFSIDFSSLIAATNVSFNNTGRVFIEQLDTNGRTLKLESTAWITPDFDDWQGIGVTSFVVPGTRSIKYGFQARKSEGASATVAFDMSHLRFWLNQMDTWNGAVFRTMRIPTLDGFERKNPANPSFEIGGAHPNGTSGITSWTYGAGSYWLTEPSDTGFVPIDGGFILRGGDNATTTPHQVYSLSQIIPIVTGGTPYTPDDITNGWYAGLFRIDVGLTDNTASVRITLEFLNAANASLVTYDTGYRTGFGIGAWQELDISGVAVTGTTKARVTIYTKSGAATSNAGAVFDNAEFHWLVTAYAKNPSDPEYAHLGPPAVEADYLYTFNAYTFDSTVIVQARTPIFNYAAVTSTVDNRTFHATAISQDAAKMYSGKITWLSGNNAGKTSFVRIWDDTGKQAKLYAELRADIQVGDKFIWARGCDKTLPSCFDIGNVTNMRAEPYLPGPTKVIEFMTVNAPTTSGG